MLHSLYDYTIPSFEKILKLYPDYFEQALTSKEAAALMDTTPAALAQMRSRGTGPDYRRLPQASSLVLALSVKKITTVFEVRFPA